jgi:hypothetical protein
MGKILLTRTPWLNGDFSRVNTLHCWNFNKGKYVAPTLKTVNEFTDDWGQGQRIRFNHEKAILATLCYN